MFSTSKRPGPRRKGAVLAGTLAAALALTPTAVWAASGGSGSWTGGGGDQAPEDTYLEVHDDFWSGSIDSPGQGLGVASIDYFWNTLDVKGLTNGMQVAGAVGDPDGTQWTWREGLSPQESFYQVCSEALQDAANRAIAQGHPEATPERSRVVGVYFSFAATSPPYWNPSAVTAEEFTSKFDVAWGHEYTDMRVDGVNRDNEDPEKAKERAAAIETSQTAYDEFVRQIAAVTDGMSETSERRMLVCVALNEFEPEVDRAFQPTVTTQAAQGVVSKGANLVDQVTVGVTGENPWVEGTSVRVEVDLYGPYPSPPGVVGEPGTTVVDPPGEPVATRSFDVTGPVENYAVDFGPATASGYWAFHARIVKENQAPQTQGLLVDSWFDQFGPTRETTVVRMDPIVTTRAANEFIDAGDMLRDEVQVSLTGEDDLWLAPNGTPIPVRVDVCVYGPYATKPGATVPGTSSTVPAGADLVDCAFVSVPGPASGATSAWVGVDVATAPGTGFYTFVASIRVANQGGNADLIQRDYYDGYGLVDETTIARMEITLDTQLTPGPSTKVDASTNQGRADLRIIEKGEPFTDTVTVSPRTGGGLDYNLWLAPEATPVAVPIRVDLHGPVDRAQPVGGPAGGGVVQTRTLVATQFGATQVAFDPVTASGCYYAVAHVDTGAPGWAAAAEYLVEGEFGSGATDGTWATGEVFCTPVQLQLATDVPAAFEVVSKWATEAETGSGDTGFADQIMVTRTDAADVWPAPGGTRIGVPLRVDTFGPFENEGDPATAADLVATTRLTITDWGTFPVPFGDAEAVEIVNLDFSADGTETGALVTAFSGWYFHRVSVDNAALSALTAAYLDDQYEMNGDDPAVAGAGQAPNLGAPATDGNWAPGESQVVRMDPVVTTTATNRVIDEADLPQPLIDTVTLTLRDWPKDQWLHTGGEPVAITVDNYAYGPFDVPKPTAANNQGGRAMHTPTPADLANPRPGTLVADTLAVGELTEQPLADGPPATRVGDEPLVFTTTTPWTPTRRPTCCPWTSTPPRRRRSGGTR